MLAKKAEAKQANQDRQKMDKENKIKTNMAKKLLEKIRIPLDLLTNTRKQPEMDLISKPLREPADEAYLVLKTIEAEAENVLESPSDHKLSTVNDTKSLSEVVHGAKKAAANLQGFINQIKASTRGR